MRRVIKHYSSSFFLLACAAAVGAQLILFPERSEGMPGDLEVWRGLPTAIAISLLLALVVLALAKAVQARRRQTTTSS